MKKLYKKKLYWYNFTIAKRYRSKFKVTICKAPVLREGFCYLRRNGVVNDKKLECHLARSKGIIEEIADCNDWDFFVTFTIDRQKYDRYALKAYYSAFTKFLYNYNRKHNLSIKYLLIPEQHKDGAWHMHGLLFGLPVGNLREFTLSENLPKYIISKLKTGAKIYDWTAYRMLLTAIYHILSKGEAYDAELYKKSDEPSVKREISVEQVVFFLRKQGFTLATPS